MSTSSVWLLLGKSEVCGLLVFMQTALCNDTKGQGVGLARRERSEGERDEAARQERRVLGVPRCWVPLQAGLNGNKQQPCSFFPRFTRKIHGLCLARGCC